MATNTDKILAFLVINGYAYDFFTDYRCGSSIFEADSPFDFGTPLISQQFLRETNSTRIDTGNVAQIFLRTPGNRAKAILQYTGIIKTIDLAVDRNGGAMFRIAGRSHMSGIVDSDAMPGFTIENTTFLELIYKVLVTPFPGESFGYFAKEQIVVDNDANRSILTGNPKAGVVLSKKAPPELENIKIDQAKPHAGETVFHYLQRHATRMGLMVWGTADGKIVFGRPNYDQQPLYDLILQQGQGRGGSTTVKSFHHKRSIEHRASEIHVYGHSQGGDDMRSPIHAVIYDDELRAKGLHRPVTFHDNNARTIEQATQRARWELSKTLQSAEPISAIVDGHSADGSAWTVDTMVSVTVPATSMVNDPRYLCARTFTRSREHGCETSLQIMPKNSVVIGDIQYVPPKVPTYGSTGTGPKVDKTNEAINQVIAKMAGSPTPLAYRDEVIAAIFPDPDHNFNTSLSAKDLK